MPIQTHQTRSKSPLARLRKIAGWSQRETAKRLGMSLIAVQKMEAAGSAQKASRREVSGDRAMQLCLITGVDPEKFQKGNLLDLYGRRVTRETIEEWQNRWYGKQSFIPGVTVPAFKGRLDLALDAAMKCGRTLELMYFIDLALQKWAVALGLLDRMIEQQGNKAVVISDGKHLYRHVAPFFRVKQYDSDTHRELIVGERKVRDTPQKAAAAPRSRLPARQIDS